MDRFRQKIKKDKPQKHADREKSNLFITDVKAIKENLKIKEILRTVKMNSSMRIKAPRGSKVMNSKDFNDNDDFVEDTSNSEAYEEDDEDPPSATNPDVVISNVDSDEAELAEEPILKDFNETGTDISKDIAETGNEFIQHCANSDTDNDSTKNESNTHTNSVVESESSENNNVPDNVTICDEKPLHIPPIQDTYLKCRDRKLSLDYTMLSRREGLSQSELDLHLIGKSPLERKSSFFRKKLESFLKNTTEIFKRQSLGSKSQPIKRRGSMSVSLQSLNETNCTNDYSSMLQNPQVPHKCVYSSYCPTGVGREYGSHYD